VIQIDVHPAGENLTNTTRTLPMPVHIHPMYASCGRSPYVATFHESSIASDGSSCSRELVLPVQPPAWLSNSQVIVYFSPKPASEAVGESQHLLTTCYLVYWAHKHQHAIDTFNTCSWVPTPRSLTDTGGGYHIETSEQPQHSPRPSRSSVPLISLMALPSLHFFQP
jgi:hypothetical protein